MGLKKWLVGNGAEIGEALREKYALTPLLAKILASRGIIEDKQLEEATAPVTGGLADPFLLADMDKAVARIRRAVEEKERVTVFGDYDVDGVTATYLVLTWLEEHGVECDAHIPSRTEGYGLSAGAVEKIAGRGTALIITVDTGITAVEEAERARELGVDMVVTDHHNCGEALPDVCAAVDPRRADCAFPYKDLAGVGVAFMLLRALEGDKDEELFARFGDVVALGTVADVMPVTGENRKIVSRGLKLLKKTKNHGLKALIKAAALSDTASESAVCFSLAPRINAAGRMASAYEALELLRAGDGASAALHADRLCALNRERQKEEAALLKKAVSMIDAEPEALRRDKCAVLCGKEWHYGTLGIVAARIAERYNLPAVLLSEEDGALRGSGRSVRGFNLHEAMCEACEGIAVCGGHDMAAGLHMEKGAFGEFKRRFAEIASARVPGEREEVLELDCEVFPEDLTFEGVESLARLEPFGTGNAAPQMCMRGMDILEITPIGNGKHVRLMLCAENRAFSALFFGVRAESLRYVTGDRVDIAFSAEINEYRSNRSIQITLKDMRPCEDRLRGERAAEKAYRRLRGGEPAESGAPLPGREEFALVWRALCPMIEGGFASFSPALLHRQVRFSGVDEFTLLVSLGIFEQAGLIALQDGETTGFNDEWGFFLRDTNGKKADLFETEIFAALSRGA